MKHKCLLIHYYFPPIHAIGAVRLYNIALYFQKFLGTVWIMTTQNRHILPNDIQNIKGFNILEAHTLDYRTLSYLLAHKNILFDEKTKLSRLARFAIKLMRSFPFNLIFGEGGIIYICHAFFKSWKVIKKENITTIFSSFAPYSDHFIAYLLKLFFPKLYWIADFRDLHVEPLYDVVFWKSFQHKCNKLILKKADCVTTVSEGLAVHLRQYHPHVYVLKSGIILPPNFHTPHADSVEKGQNILKTQTEFTKFTISYTGSMFGNERDPRLFLKVIRDLVDKNIVSRNTFQIVYAGKDTAVWKDWIALFKLEDYFVPRGMLSGSEAKMIQKQSHINLLLTSSTPEWTGVMTGKFYEYLAAQNPILVLINGTQDVEFESVMTDLAAGFLGYNDKSFEETRHFILTKFQEWQQTGHVLQTIRREKMTEMTWSSVVQKFIRDVLER